MTPRFGILTDEEIKRIHDGTVQVLRDVGVRVHHDAVLDRLAEAGAQVDKARRSARIDEKLLRHSLEVAGKSYILYGRDGTRTARFGYGDLVTISSPGQYSWVDSGGGSRRPPTSRDTLRAITVGDALEHIDIVGAMTQPEDIPTPIRDVYLTAALVKNTKKPARCWIANGQTAHYILEIYKAVAGGAEALRERPQIEAFVEPISPLQMPTTGMEILLEFTALGLPVSYGPMVQASATGPATLAGTLVQENAENLAAIVITQVLRPGTPVMYGGIPHIMDPRTTSISFGSPEQALMGVAMVQIARSYGLPAYINVGLSDANALDVQSGLERGITFILGALAGANLCGHFGILGADQAAHLPLLVVDNQMVAYTRRIMRSFEVNQETLAVELIKEIGPAGQYLGHEHTAAHFRREFWIPPLLWNRLDWDVWRSEGGQSMAERAAQQVEDILTSHQLEPIEEDLEREIDAIVDAAQKHLLK